MHANSYQVGSQCLRQPQILRLRLRMTAPGWGCGDSVPGGLPATGRNPPNASPRSSPLVGLEWERNSPHICHPETSATRETKDLRFLHRARKWVPHLWRSQRWEAMHRTPLPKSPGCPIQALLLGLSGNECKSSPLNARTDLRNAHGRFARRHRYFRVAGDLPSNLLRSSLVGHSYCRRLRAAC